MNISFYMPTIKDFAERAAKTFAQAFLAAGTVSVGSAGLSDVPWQHAGEVGLVAVVYSILTSLASLKFGNPGTASATRSVELAP